MGKFLLDMGISPKIIPFLKEKGFEVEHCSDLGLGKSSDRAVLKHAIIQKQILLTTDLDFGQLIAVKGLSAPGLIIFRLINPSVEMMIRRMEAVLENFSIEDIVCSIIIVEPSRIRRTKLPIVKGDEINA
jgi:predicted nuclease of predicted toxin-antitoxin system